MELFLRGKVWWCRFTHDGEQKRISTKTRKKTEAQVKAADILKAVERGENPEEVIKVIPTLKEFITDYFSKWVVNSRKLKPKSKRDYLYGISLLSAQEIYSKRLNKITAEDVDMMSIPGSSSTFNCAIRTLRRVLNIAISKEIITKYPKLKTLPESNRKVVIDPSEENKIASVLAGKRVGRDNGGILSAAFPLHSEMKLLPFEIVNIKIEDIDLEKGILRLRKSGRTVSITKGAREALIRQSRGKSDWLFPSARIPGKPVQRQAITKALIRMKKGRPYTSALQAAWPIHMDTGMRPHEMAHVRIENIDFKAGRIYLETSKTEKGKRFILITDRAKEILFAIVGQRSEGWLFPSPRYPGKPITSQALTVAFAKARKLAGVPKSKKLYSARHTFGTDLMEATRDPKLVMEMMGHKDLRTTMIYLHPETDKAASLLNERNLRRKLESSDSESVN